MIRAIIFDFYDTLVYRDFASTERTRTAIAALFGVSVHTLNALWRRDRDARMLGQIATLDDHLRLMLGELGVAPTPALLHEAAMLELDGQRAAVHPYPRAMDTLRRLREAGFLLGLLSNTSDAAKVPLDHLGMNEVFDVMILSHEVGLLKPDPRIYHLACERLGVRPEECVFVADGGFGELDAAHGVGMLAVKVVQDGQSPDYGSSNYHDVLLTDVGGLLDLAEGWRSARKRGG